jgi:competence protein ComEC
MRSPLIVLAACFALGIAGARPDPTWLPGVPFLLATAGACLLGGLVTLRGRWQRVSSVLALAGFVAGGAVAAQLFAQRFPPNHLSRLTQLGVDLEDPVRLEARLVSNPVRASYGLQFDVEVTRAESRGQAHAVTGKARLRLQLPEEAEALAAADSLRLQYGDLIRVLVRLRRPRVYENPGSFDFRRWMESVEDVYYVGTIKSPLLIEKLPNPNPPRLGAWVENTRRRFLEGIDRLYPPWSAAGRDGSVLKAVLLGDRSSLDSDTIENFRKTGLYHLLVISGLHVGLLAMVTGLLLRFLRLSETWRSVLLMLFLLGYAALVEQRAPTLRATLMIFLYLAARFLYRKESGLNAIGLAALVLLLRRPAWLFESGFQLSFSAALLIAGLAVPILERTTAAYLRALWRLHEVDWDISFEPRLAQFRLDTRALVTGLTRPFYFFHQRPAMAAAAVTAPLRIALWAANMLLFSAILQLGLLLPMAETFHRVTYAGIGLNALAIPLMTLLLGLAVPTVLLSATLPTLAVWPGKALALVMHGLFALTDQPRLPAWLSYRVPEPPGWVSWGFALAIVAAALALARHRRTFWASLAAASIFGALISLHPFSPQLPRGALEVTALDCGGGDALFVVLPDRTTMLVDGGGFRLGSAREGAFRGRRWEPGEDIVSPYLWSRGVKKVDVVALSHAHEDHLGGLAAVVRNFRIGEFWHGANAPTPGYEGLLADVRRRAIPTRLLAAGERIPLGGTAVEILWPPRDRLTGQRPSNDDSVVMRISSAGSSVLLPGDISNGVERELVRSGMPLRSQLLKVAHHGGRTSSSAEFLARVSPSIALVTVEGGNPSGSPSPEALERLQAAGAKTYRTDIAGALTVELRGAQLSVRAYGTSPAD